MNHAGLSMSYTKTWEYLKKLSNEAHYKDQVKEGNWIWVYDNFNLHEIRGKLLYLGNNGINASVETSLRCLAHVKGGSLMNIDAASVVRGWLQLVPIADFPIPAQLLGP